MPKEQNELTNQDEDKDILDVADELFGGVGENDATEDETEKDSEEVSDDADSDEEKDLSEESTEAEEESAESSDQTDSEAEEQESAENQSEEEDNQDSSDEATTESETEEQEEKDESLIEDSEQDSNESEDESAQVSQADESQEQVDEKAEETESEVEETVDELTKLRQENARLRAHLHYMLAERVVDAKIAIGLVDPAERHAELAEHEKRSAGSLADALKDIERFSAVMPNRGVANPSELMNSKLEVTSSEEGVIEGEVEEQEEEKPVSPQTKLEEYVTDVLMGRRKLVNGPIK